MSDFYESREWQRLRYDILRRSRGCCELCGVRSGPHVILQVDHIKPRSKHPELALEPSNLQVLCRTCNMGKGARDSTDWRTLPDPIATLVPAHREFSWPWLYGRASQQLKAALMKAEQSGDELEQTRIMRKYLKVQRRMAKCRERESA
jgi:hypothetical protein